MLSSMHFQETTPGLSCPSIVELLTVPWYLSVELE